MTQDTIHKKLWTWIGFILLVITALITLYPYIYHRLFLEDIQESINKSKNEFNQRAEIFPMIDKKLSLYSKGIVKLNAEEYETLNDIWYEELEPSAKEWFLTNITKAINDNSLYFQGYATYYPESVHNIRLWVEGRKSLNDHEIYKLIDEYYGYISQIHD